MPVGVSDGNGSRVGVQVSLGGSGSGDSVGNALAVDAGGAAVVAVEDGNARTNWLVGDGTGVTD